MYCNETVLDIVVLLVAKLCLTLLWPLVDCSPPGSSVRGVPDGSDGEESACNAGDTGLFPG